MTSSTPTSVPPVASGSAQRTLRAVPPPMTTMPPAEHIKALKEHVRVLIASATRTNLPDAPAQHEFWQEPADVHESIFKFLHHAKALHKVFQLAATAEGMTEQQRVEQDIANLEAQLQMKEEALATIARKKEEWTQLLEAAKKGQ